MEREMERNELLFLLGPRWKSPNTLSLPTKASTGLGKLIKGKKSCPGKSQIYEVEEI
jgi:hypothetical protein